MSSPSSGNPWGFFIWLCPWDVPSFALLAFTTKFKLKTPVPERLGPDLVLLDSCMHDSIVLFQRPRDKMHLVEV